MGLEGQNSFERFKGYEKLKNKEKETFVQTAKTQEQLLDFQVQEKTQQKEKDPKKKPEAQDEEESLDSNLYNQGYMHYCDFAAKKIDILSYTTGIFCQDILQQSQLLAAGNEHLHDNLKKTQNIIAAIQNIIESMEGSQGGILEQVSYFHEYIHNDLATNNGPSHSKRFTQDIMSLGSYLQDLENNYLNLLKAGAGSKTEYNDKSLLQSKKFMTLNNLRSVSFFRPLDSNPPKEHKKEFNDYILSWDAQQSNSKTLELQNKKFEFLSHYNQDTRINLHVDAQMQKNAFFDLYEQKPGKEFKNGIEEVVDNNLVTEVIFDKKEYGSQITYINDQGIEETRNLGCRFNTTINVSKGKDENGKDTDIRKPSVTMLVTDKKTGQEYEYAKCDINGKIQYLFTGIRNADGSNNTTIVAPPRNSSPSFSVGWINSPMTFKDGNQDIQDTVKFPPKSNEAKTENITISGFPIGEMTNAFIYDMINNQVKMGYGDNVMSVEKVLEGQNGYNTYFDYMKNLSNYISGGANVMSEILDYVDIYFQKNPKKISQQIDAQQLRFYLAKSIQKRIQGELLNAFGDEVVQMVNDHKTQCDAVDTDTSVEQGMKQMQICNEMLGYFKEDTATEAILKSPDAQLKIQEFSQTVSTGNDLTSKQYEELESLLLRITILEPQREEFIKNFKKHVDQWKIYRSYKDSKKELVTQEDNEKIKTFMKNSIVADCNYWYAKSVLSGVLDHYGEQVTGYPPNKNDRIQKNGAKPGSLASKNPALGWFSDLGGIGGSNRSDQSWAIQGKNLKAAGSFALDVAVIYFTGGLAGTLAEMGVLGGAKLLMNGQRISETGKLASTLVRLGNAAEKVHNSVKLGRGLSVFGAHLSRSQRIINGSIKLGSIAAEGEMYNLFSNLAKSCIGLQSREEASWNIHSLKAQLHSIATIGILKSLKINSDTLAKLTTNDAMKSAVTSVLGEIAVKGIALGAEVLALRGVDNAINISFGADGQALTTDYVIETVKTILALRLAHRSGGDLFRSLAKNLSDKQNARDRKKIQETYKNHPEKVDFVVSRGTNGEIHLKVKIIKGTRADGSKVYEAEEATLQVINDEVQLAKDSKEHDNLETLIKDKGLNTETMTDNLDSAQMKKEELLDLLASPLYKLCGETDITGSIRYESKTIDGKEFDTYAVHCRPKNPQKNGYNYVSYSIHVEKVSGKKYFHLDGIGIDKKHQNNGYGTMSFNNLITQLKNQGFSHLTLSGESDANLFNGSYTWAILGCEADESSINKFQEAGFSIDQASKLHHNKTLAFLRKQGYTSLQDFLSDDGKANTSEKREAQRQKLRAKSMDFLGYFDLKDNSPSQKALENYRKDKKIATAEKNQQDFISMIFEITQLVMDRNIQEQEKIKIKENSNKQPSEKYKDLEKNATSEKYNILEEGVSLTPEQIAEYIELTHNLPGDLFELSTTQIKERIAVLKNAGFTWKAIKFLLKNGYCANEKGKGMSQGGIDREFVDFLSNESSNMYNEIVEAEKELLASEDGKNMMIQISGDYPNKSTLNIYFMIGDLKESGQMNDKEEINRRLKELAIIQDLGPIKGKYRELTYLSTEAGEYCQPWQGEAEMMKRRQTLADESGKGNYKIFAIIKNLVIKLRSGKCNSVQDFYDTYNLLLLAVDGPSKMKETGGRRRMLLPKTTNPTQTTPSLDTVKKDTKFSKEEQKIFESNKKEFINRDLEFLYDYHKSGFNLTDTQKECIRESYIIGKGEIGKDGKKIDMFGEGEPSFTDIHIQQKIQHLRKGKIPERVINLLLKNDVFKIDQNNQNIDLLGIFDHDATTCRALAKQGIIGKDENGNIINEHDIIIVNKVFKMNAENKFKSAKFLLHGIKLSSGEPLNLDFPFPEPVSINNKVCKNWKDALRQIHKMSDNSAKYKELIKLFKMAGIEDIKIQQECGTTLLRRGVCGKWKGKESIQEIKKTIEKGSEKINKIDENLLTELSEVLPDTFQYKQELLRWVCNSMDAHIKYVKNEEGFKKYFFDRLTQNSRYTTLRFIDAWDEIWSVKNKLYDMMFVQNKKNLFQFSPENTKEVDTLHNKLRKLYSNVDNITLSTIENIFIERPSLFQYLNLIKSKFPNGLSSNDYVDSGFNGIILKLIGKDVVLKLSYKDNEQQREDEHLNHRVYRKALEDLKNEMPGLEKFTTPEVGTVNGAYEMEYISGSVSIQQQYIKFILTSQFGKTITEANAMNKYELLNFYSSNVKKTYPTIPTMLGEMYGNGIKNDFTFIIEELYSRGVVAEDIDQSCLPAGSNKSNPANLLIRIKPGGDPLKIEDISFVLIDFASTDIKDTPDGKFKYATYKSKITPPPKKK